MTSCAAWPDPKSSLASVRTGRSLRRNHALATARPLLLSLLALALALVTGCTATRVRARRTLPLSTFLARSQPYASQAYRIVAGDQLSTRCYFNPQLDEDVQVRPDGKISLSLLGEVPAAGRTVAELSAAVTKGYETYFVKATAVVIVRAFNGARVFTAGELQNPGGFSILTGARTVLESISMSGGITNEATLKQIILIRRLPGTTEPMVAELRIADALSGEDPTQNVDLMPGDFVYVPKSGAADFNLAMQQYLLNNLNTSTYVGVGTNFALRK